MTLLSGVILAICSVISGYLTNKYGRRTILLIGDGFCCLFLLLIGILCYVYTLNEKEDFFFLTVLIILMIFLYEISFNISLGPVTWTYNADILNENGIAIATFSNWISCFAVSLIFPILVEKWNLHSLFYIYSGVCLLGYIFIFKYVLETKGILNIELF